MIGVLEEIARVIAATSRGVAGIWAGRAGKRVMFWRFRVTASWERARALRSRAPSWRAFCFAAFVVKIGDPRLVAYLEEAAHSLPTGEEVAVWFNESGLLPVLGVGPVSLGAGPPFLAGREVGGDHLFWGQCRLFPPTSLWPHTC